MKLYLTLDEMKNIREALYTKVGKLRAGLSDKDLKPAFKETLDEDICNDEKLISYFNEMIRKEDV